MPKPNEVKLAADIIRRVLDAAERGDVAFLSQLRTASRRRPQGSTIPSVQAQESLDVDQASPDEPSQESILEEIGRFQSEIDLEKFLKMKYPTKSDLIGLARAIHIPTPKTDDYESLLERVVASTIGYKMRSEAVRGSQISARRKDGGKI